MHNIKEFIDMNEKDFDSFFNILDNSFPYTSLLSNTAKIFFMILPSFIYQTPHKSQTSIYQITTL